MHGKEYVENIAEKRENVSYSALSKIYMYIIILPVFNSILANSPKILAHFFFLGGGGCFRIPHIQKILTSPMDGKAFSDCKLNATQLMKFLSLDETRNLSNFIIIFPSPTIFSKVFL